MEKYIKDQKFFADPEESKKDEPQRVSEKTVSSSSHYAAPSASQNKRKVEEILADDSILGPNGMNLFGHDALSPPVRPF